MDKCEINDKLKELSVQKKVDKSNLNYYMALGGLWILLGWAIYMLVSLCSLIKFGNISPEVYTIVKHGAIVLVGLILALRGTSRLQRT